MRHVQGFLAEGHKVKVSLQFRGREMAHPELGSKILDEVIEKILSVGKVETQARLEGRSMTMVLVPDKKPVKKEKAATTVESEVDVNPAVEIETALETAPIEVIETPAVSEE